MLYVIYQYVVVNPGEKPKQEPSNQISLSSWRLAASQANMYDSTFIPNWILLICPW